ncbi:alpha/beta hydrolase [Actinoplanes sp. NPDC051633]|uniref:alpha/beta hydrolase n=1 Tax=Actinoplanes sp. NPDC051633 TaxID=3155670 RepID=UPI003427710A
MRLLRYQDWISPVPPVRREVLSAAAEGDQPVLFVPGPGFEAAVFAEHWLAHTAERGFPAHALTARDGGDLRAYAHDVVQTAAALPRQAVLVGHGVGAMIVAQAMGRYPARAAVLACPVLDRGALWRAGLLAVLGAPVRLSPAQARPARVPRPRALPRPVGDPPVLVVGSPDDKVVPRRSLDRAAAGYGGAPLLFPGMGHDLMVGPGWVEPIDAILDWLGKELAA